MAILKTLFGKSRLPAVEAQVRAAREHLRQERRSEAISAAEAVLASQHDHAEALYIRGTAKLELGNGPESLDDLQRAVSLAPHEPGYVHNLAMAHHLLGDVATASRLCREIVARHDFPPAYVLLASLQLPGPSYFEMLSRLHRHLTPGLYVEVGVFQGQSLRLALPDTHVVGIDPAPGLTEPPGPNHSIVAQTSDEFFGRHDLASVFRGRAIDMAFIDGMHRFEYALRDFANVERHARKDSVVLMHDCWPMDRTTAARERVTQLWSGDVWRLIALLKKYRPDLIVRTIGAPPTGLGLVLNLDPSSRFIMDNHDRLVEEYLALDYAYVEQDRGKKLGFLPNDWDAVRAVIDARPPS
jgi:tetratricopeptide (TPR) repeat protein